jgi:urease accessory protein
VKLSMNVDFTKFARATSVLTDREAGSVTPFDLAVLTHDERHVRRRVIELVHGDRVLVDLPQAVMLRDRDRLVLEDGRQAEIIAADEELHEIRARDAVQLAELAWHIGNRHLAAAIEPGRILILRDHVIKAMLQGLGATVTDVVEPFDPVRGAYSGHGHAHGHDHADASRHDHDHRDGEGHGHGHGHD